MELTFSQQTTAFLYSLIFGTAAGLFYDIFKIIRMTFCKSKISVFVLDLIYVLIVSLNLFIFSAAYMFGFVRVFVMSRKIKKILKKLLKNSNKILYNVNKNKGIFRNNDNNSVEKADSFKNEKKHKERK